MDNVSKSNNGLITAEFILEAYTHGFFPMADENGEIGWHCPDPRAVFPLYDLKMPRSLKKTIEKSNFEFKINNNFDRVIKECSAREDTWISEDIIELYTELNRLDFCWSFETYQDNELVGGLYGISIAKAFFGESMFTKVSGASKAAFYFLVNFLKENNYVLLDSQFINRHTEMLGAVLIRRSQYMRILNFAINS